VFNQVMQECVMSPFRKISFAIVTSVLAMLLISIPVAAADEPAEAQSQSQTTTSSGSASSATADDTWHFGITPYLWFAGMSGTVGALGRDAGVHVSPGDLLSHFHIGLMGVVEARKNRLVLPIDFMWINLQASKGLPFDQDLSSVQVKVTETILTPKIGYRIVDNEKIKVDALVGLRYWHLGQHLNFQPSGVFNNLAPTQNWVDGVAGAKIEAALSPKVLVTVLGDAGGGGSNSDYQVAGLLGLKICKKAILQMGWRYLYVDYRTNAPKLAVFDVHESGALLGVTFNLK
jgi:hypothetical protein